MHGTTPFNDFVAEVVKQYRTHLQISYFYLVLRCARAIVGDDGV